MSQSAVLPGTEVHVVHSDAVGVDFRISVHRPPIDGPLPVVYVTDANWFFGTSMAITNMLLKGGEIPPVLTVGIGYPDDDELFITTRRMYDFSPTTDQWQLDQLGASELMEGGMKAGGAADFIAFMRDELAPWLSQRFDVAEDRTYLGDSMGGLFGTYVLLNHHGFFNRYVIGSPWLCWDKPLCFDYEAAYAASHDDLDATVFLSAGGAEDVMSPEFDASATTVFDAADTEAHTIRMGEALAGRNYPSLRLKTLIFPEETHFTVPFFVAAHGLRYVFQAT